MFIDENGRERIFHGVNVIVKGPPWVPDVTTFSVDISLTDRDFQIMQQLGLNVIRLGTMWPGSYFILILKILLLKLLLSL